MKQPDFVVEAGEFATVWTFTPKSERAKELVENEFELEDWQWLGESFAVDHRPARDLCASLASKGYNIFNPRYGWFVTRH